MTNWSLDVLCTLVDTFEAFCVVDSYEQLLAKVSVRVVGRQVKAVEAVTDDTDINGHSGHRIESERVSNKKADLRQNA